MLSVKITIYEFWWLRKIRRIFSHRNRCKTKGSYYIYLSRSSLYKFVVREKGKSKKRKRIVSGNIIGQKHSRGGTRMCMCGKLQETRGIDCWNRRYHSLYLSAGKQLTQAGVIFGPLLSRTAVRPPGTKELYKHTGFGIYVTTTEPNEDPPARTR